MSHRAALASILLSACAFSGDGMDATPADTGRRDAVPMDADPMDAGAIDADQADADPPDVGPTGPRVEVGTGSIRYEPLTAGETIAISSGPQGGGRFLGFHIWFGARIQSLDPEAITARFIVLLASDRSEQARLEWNTNFRPTATDAYEIWGANPRLMDCCLVVSTDLIMRVEVVDADGLTASSEIEVRGEDMCADLTMSYCP